MKQNQKYLQELILSRYEQYDLNSNCLNHSDGAIDNERDVGLLYSGQSSGHPLFFLLESRVLQLQILHLGHLVLFLHLLVSPVLATSVHVESMLSILQLIISQSLLASPVLHLHSRLLPDASLLHDSLIEVSILSGINGLDELDIIRHPGWVSGVIHEFR